LAWAKDSGYRALGMRLEGGLRAGWVTGITGRDRVRARGGVRVRLRVS
jgi:hypothetical protein